MGTSGAPSTLNETRRSIMLGIYYYLCYYHFFIIFIFYVILQLWSVKIEGAHVNHQGVDAAWGFGFEASGHA